MYPEDRLTNRFSHLKKEVQWQDEYDNPSLAKRNKDAEISRESGSQIDCHAFYARAVDCQWEFLNTCEGSQLEGLWHIKIVSTLDPSARESLLSPLGSALDLLLSTTPHFRRSSNFVKLVARVDIVAYHSRPQSFVS